MNKLCLMCLLLLFTLSCSDTKTDLNELNLKVKVKSIKECFFVVMEDGPKREEGISMLVDFNDEIYSNEAIVSFNKKGMKDTASLSSYSSTPDVYNTYSEVFSYTNNRIVSKKSFDNKELYSELKYTYNNENKLILTELFDANNSLIEETKIEYSGDKEYNRIFLPSERIYYMVEKTLNSAGYFTEKITLNEDKKQTGKQVNSYNKAGRVAESILYNENNIKYQRLTYKYDEYNNEIEFCAFDLPENELLIRYTYTYEYDKHKNWVKQTTKMDDSETFITREITYY